MPNVSLEYSSGSLDTSRKWSGMWVFVSIVNRLSSNLSKASEKTKKKEKRSYLWFYENVWDYCTDKTFKCLDNIQGFFLPRLLFVGIITANITLSQFLFPVTG